MMVFDKLNVIIAGVGGQGNVLASQLIALAAVEAGYEVTVGETFGASQRGGSVMSHVRLNSKNSLGPLIPKGMADVIVGFEPMETLRILGVYGNPRTKVLVNTRPVYPIKVLAGEQVYPNLNTILQGIKEHVAIMVSINATDIALEVGKAVVANMVMVGALSGTGFVPIKQEHFLKVIKNHFGEKLLEMNEKAFFLGLNNVVQRIK